MAFGGGLLVRLGFGDDDGGFGGVSHFELVGDFCSPIAILTFPATMERSRLHEPSVFVYLRQTDRYNPKKITIYFLGFRGYGIQWGEKPRSEWDLCAIPSLCSYRNSLSNQNPSFLIFVMFVFP